MQERGLDESNPRSSADAPSSVDNFKHRTVKGTKKHSYAIIGFFRILHQVGKIPLARIPFLIDNISFSITGKKRINIHNITNTFLGT